MAFGQPTTSGAVGACPEHVQHTGARSPRPDARHGVALGSSSAMKTWNHQRDSGLGSSGMAPQHRDLLKLARKGVSTRAAVSLVVVLGVEEGNGGEKGWGWCRAAARARERHKELMWTLGQ
jgi:hypothetical protein